MVEKDTLFALEPNTKNIVFYMGYASITQTKVKLDVRKNDAARWYWVLDI